jgi:hypothetical protein
MIALRNESSNGQVHALTPQSALRHAHDAAMVYVQGIRGDRDLVLIEQIICVAEQGLKLNVLSKISFILIIGESSRMILYGRDTHHGSRDKL